MRLIDADALKKDLKSVTLSNGTLVNTNAVLYLLEEYPTAYDVDKVVEQLGKLKKAEQDRPDDCDEDGCGDGEQIYDDGRSQGRFEAFGKAIEIVKGGGSLRYDSTAVSDASRTMASSSGVSFRSLVSGSMGTTSF